VPVAGMGILANAQLLGVGREPFQKSPAGVTVIEALEASSRQDVIKQEMAEVIGRIDSSIAWGSAGWP